MNQTFRLILRLHGLFFLLIGFGVGFRVFNHLFDIGIAQAAAGLNTNGLFLVCRLVFGGNVDNAVGVNIERNLNLRHAARRRRNAHQIKLTEQLVVGSHFALTLENTNGHRRLPVFRRRKNLRLTGRNGGVAVYQPGKHAAQSFNTERQRRNIQKQHVFNVAHQHAALNGRADGNDFVRVNAFVRVFAENFFHFFLHFRHTGHAADKDNLAHFVGFQPGIGQSFAAGFHRAFNQIVNQRFQFGAGQFDVQVFRPRGVRGNKRQVNIRLRGRRQLYLGFFGRFFQSLQRQAVVLQIYAAFLFELFGQIVDNALVKIFAAEECVAVGGFYLKHAVADFQNGNIKSAAAEVVNGNRAVFVFIQTIGQSRRCRFVDDTQHVKPRDFAGIFGRLSLRIVKISRNGNHRLIDFLAEVTFGIFFYFLQNNGRNLRRGIFLSLNFHPGVAVVARNNLERNQIFVFFDFRRIVTAADQTLDGKQSVFRIGYRLTLCRGADQTFVVGKSDNRRCGAGAFAVFQNLGFSAFHNRKAGVCRAKVNAYNFIAHNFISLVNLSC